MTANGYSILFIIKRTCFQVKNIESHPFLEETSQTTKSEEYYLPHFQNYDGISQHRNQKHLNKYLQEDCEYYHLKRSSTNGLLYPWKETKVS